jgi:hypothetical protein
MSMKKVMVLFIVLGVVSIANAGVIDLVITSLNGEFIYPVKEITLAPSDIIGMDVIWNTTEQNRWLYSVSVDVVAIGPGTLSCDAPIWPAGVWDMNFASIIPHDGKIGISTFAMYSGIPSPGGIIVGHILMHYDGEPMVIVELVQNDNLPSGITCEIDEDINIYDVTFGDGVRIFSCGCVEPPQTSCWDCPAQEKGDVNGDGIVGTTDLLSLKKSWLKTSSDTHGTATGQYNCCCDFNHDGSVNTSDLLIMKQNWLKSFGTCTTVTCP